MTNTGDRLIEAQRLEEGLQRKYSDQPTENRLAELSAARRTVETCAKEYLQAVQNWRLSIELAMQEHE